MQCRTVLTQHPYGLGMRTATGGMAMQIALDRGVAAALKDQRRAIFKDFNNSAVISLVTDSHADHCPEFIHTYWEFFTHDAPLDIYFRYNIGRSSVSLICSAEISHLNSKGS